MMKVEDAVSYLHPPQKILKLAWLFADNTRPRHMQQSRWTLNGWDRSTAHSP
jgi:hypothetical protein